jgi:hypothetical protein
VPTARLPQPSTETSEKPPTALTIRTTGEHRFYVRGKGWLPAGELRPGDRLRSAHGPDPVVLALTDEQEETVVYNLRVAWYHTYFVGDRDWPCSVWAHNAYQAFVEAATARKKVSSQAARRQYFRIKQRYGDSPEKMATAIRKYLVEKAGMEPGTEELEKAVQQSLIPDSKQAGVGTTARGNQFHYDQMNGSTGHYGPSQLQERYRKTVFRFARRGESGPDVEVIRGEHPSNKSVYPETTWEEGNNYGDFKPNTEEGRRKFRKEIESGKLPQNTQLLLYDPEKLLLI